MLQLIFYKILVSTAPEYQRYRVTRGHILFVTQDKAEKEVHDKIYEYTAADEDSLKQLMKAVYGLITSLKFLDDPEIMLAPDKTRAMHDVRDFITLLLAKSGVE